MFERPHHRRIAALLGVLDAQLLADCECWFGGGTAMALRFGEYRESVDVDFMVSQLDGYRRLRQLLTTPTGIAPLCRAGEAPPEQLRELRADQYGLRTLLQIDGVPIKFEIVLEARIAFAVPAPADRIAGVLALTPLDMLASKLLANSDRWADKAVLSRDLIDLAMMAPRKPLLQQAIAKAEQAYGASVRADLDKAVLALKDQPQRLDQCMQAMAMDRTPKALLWSRIRELAKRAAP